MVGETGEKSPSGPATEPNLMFAMVEPWRVVMKMIRYHLDGEMDREKQVQCPQRGQKHSRDCSTIIRIAKMQVGEVKQVSWRWGTGGKHHPRTSHHQKHCYRC